MVYPFRYEASSQNRDDKKSMVIKKRRPRRADFESDFDDDDEGLLDHLRSGEGVAARILSRRAGFGAAYFGLRLDEISSWNRAADRIRTGDLLLGKELNGLD